jgi:hypothetical protein
MKLLYLAFQSTTSFTTFNSLIVSQPIFLSNTKTPYGAFENYSAGVSSDEVSVAVSAGASSRGASATTSAGVSAGIAISSAITSTGISAGVSGVDTGAGVSSTAGVATTGAGVSSTLGSGLGARFLGRAFLFLPSTIL